jgi:hypothetical protein
MRRCCWKLLALAGVSFLAGFAAAWVRERCRSMALYDPDLAPDASPLDPHRPVD